MGKRLIPPEPSDVQAIALREALEERYLAYALSTIMHRALPDARDGLKPVHRRLLFAMRQLRLDPGQAFKKSARVVGDVIGKYHPHGDQSVYDALVRLAQDFAQRYPLVDGQGNFGNIDGDNPAAMRYTESRMTEVARLLLDGIDEDAVDFRPTYDGSESEPIVLPGAFPNLLANGSTGHRRRHGDQHSAAQRRRALRRGAVPDRQSERARQDAAEIHSRVRTFRPAASSSIRRRRSPRPMPPAAARSACARAGTRKRPAAAPIRSSSRKFPGSFRRHGLIERMAELFNDKKLPLIDEFRDELTEDVRVVIEPKSRTVDAGILMESLFKLTELESRISLNMNVLSKGKVPKVMDLAEVLKEWLDHRREVLIRRSKHRLARNRPPPRSARRLAGRLSQPRQGHQDHPQRGRAQARPDQDLQDQRRAGRRHPQHAAAQLAQARRDGDQDREQGAGARRRPVSRS